MIPGFGKTSIVIGSAAHCDIRLGAPGVAPEHARIEHRGGGSLVFVDNAAGPSFAKGAPLAPGESRPFDFQTEFAVGQAAVPKAHPAITLMLLERGKAPFTPGQLVFGRDPARSNIAIHHPNVSSHHATFSLNPLTVTDHNSTSGTWLNQQGIPPSQPQTLDPRGFVALGPVAMPVDLVLHLAGIFGAGAGAPSSGATPPGTALAPQHSGEPAGQADRATPRPKHKTVVGQIRMADSASGSTKTIGRTPENDIQIPHPQVSSRHAVLHVSGGQLFIEDKGSANGTYVRGQRIPANQRVPVQNGEKVLIGPMPLLLQSAGGEVAVVVEDAANWEGRPLYEIEAWDLLMQVPDRDNPGELKTLLDHVSFKALPGDLIALMGPSGAGKTTLLLTLNGYLPPSAGQVRINGEDLYAIYDALRGSIGYVPQDDIVHPELTVWKAVKYSAQFRLPPDYSEQEINARVEQTLRDLGLEGVQNLQIGKPEKKVLSGGQRKRVNIALELVTDPVIVFLDEPTSGLAADDTTSLINLLADLTKKTGKTIIMTIHQPAKDEFEKFNLCFIMGYGGIPTYFGPTGEPSYRFFRSILDNPQSPFRNMPIAQGRTVDNPR